MVGAGPLRTGCGAQKSRERALDSGLPVDRLKYPVWRHRLIQIAADALLVAAAYYLAFRLRFLDASGGIPERYDHMLANSIGFVVVGQLIIFYISGLYEKWWRYFRLPDMIAVLRACAISTAILAITFLLLKPFDDQIPRSVVVSDFLLTVFLVGGARLLARMVLVERLARRDVRGARRVLVVGAGSGGQMVARELQLNPNLAAKAIGFLDDDPRKRGMRLHSINVLGTTEEVGEVLDEMDPDEVIIAIPSAPGVMRGRVVTACRERDVPVRTLPTVFELLRGGVQLTRQLREVQVEDVLGREPVKMELDRVGAYMQDKVVLVTGAGGSIGSELVRQIARVRPKLLVILDHAEDNLFRIDREMIEERHFTRVESVLADCKEPERMLEVMQRFRPDVVFHAAAYKHVPLMEANPARGDPQQRDRDPGHGRDRGGLRLRALRPRLHRQGGQPAHGDGRLQGDGGVDRRGGRAQAPPDPLRHGALRQRSRLLGQRRADLPEPDRARGAGHGHRPGDDPLLHDHPRGGPAGDPLRRSRRRER